LLDVTFAQCGERRIDRLGAPLLLVRCPWVHVRLPPAFRSSGSHRKIVQTSRQNIRVSRVGRTELAMILCISAGSSGSASPELREFSAASVSTGPNFDVDIAVRNLA
jgi:hypothetical protein